MVFKESELRNKLAEAKNIHDLNFLKKKWSTEFTGEILKKITLSKCHLEKKKLGKEINEIIKKGDIIFNEFKEKFLYKFNNKKIELEVENSNLSSFSNNLITQTQSELILFFKNLNFKVESGDEVVTFKENFSDLLMDNHPSTSESETFFLSKKNVLRTHCTTNSIIQLMKQTELKDFRLMTIGNVYRKDDADSTHTLQFNQSDFLWVSKNLNLTNLKWLVVNLCKFIFGDKQEHRIRNSYFPFTDPSFEMDLKCHCNKKKDCKLCGGYGWIEVMGFGMLEKKIIEKSIYSKGLKNNEEYSAIAGGIGIERLIAIKYKISDIRDLYKNNFLFLNHDY